MLDNLKHITRNREKKNIYVYVFLFGHKLIPDHWEWLLSNQNATITTYIKLNQNARQQELSLLTVIL